MTGTAPGTTDNQQPQRPGRIPDEGPGIFSPKQKREIFSFFKTLLFLVIAAIILRGTVVEAFKIPSRSMVPTLRKGDFILVSKLSYGIRLPFFRETLVRYSSPQRGDVVVFTRPDEVRTKDEDESAINIIKRVVAVGGDTIEHRDRKLYVNGKAVEENYAQYTGSLFFEGEYPRTEVPEGTIFLMGDNRDHSRDSRFWENAFLPVELVKGRALIIYWSFYDWWRIGTLIR